MVTVPATAPRQTEHHHHLHQEYGSVPPQRQ